MNPALRVSLHKQKHKHKAREKRERLVKRSVNTFVVCLGVGSGFEKTARVRNETWFGRDPEAELAVTPAK